MSSFAIQSPKNGAWAACRMLLPKTIPQGARFEYRIAIDRDQDSVVGAAAFTDNGAGLHGLQIHTVRNRRAEGIGTELLNHVFEEAARRGRTELSASISSKSDADYRAFLCKRGFSVHAQLATVEAGAELYYRHRERTRRSNRIELEGAEIVPLSTDMLREAGQLMIEHLSGLQPFESGGYFVTPRTVEIGLSQVLLVAGILEGMILVTLKEDLLTCEARVVRPQFRNTRASAALMLRTIEVAWERGARRVRFRFGDNAKDTAAFVKRMKLEVVDSIEQLIRPLGTS